jgi:hypothetical protein
MKKEKYRSKRKILTNDARSTGTPQRHRLFQLISSIYEPGSTLSAVSLSLFRLSISLWIEFIDRLKYNRGKG